MNSKERIYATLAGRPVDRIAVTPIFMAWAAHYIGRSYRDYYLDGEVLTTAQLAVTRDLGIDQISAISDPWREASAYGMQFNYPEEGVGIPRDTILKTPEDIARLAPLAIDQYERTRQRVESVKAMSAAIGQTHSVLGWVEGPLAEYADLRGLEHALIDLMDNPELYLQAVEPIVETAIAFALAQINAGADMIGIGDAAASLVGATLYREYVLPYEKRLINAIHAAGATAKLHICGNISAIIHDMAQTGADIIDVDWMVPLDHARRQVGPDITLCGNIDPTSVILQGTPESIRQAAANCIQLASHPFILMPGCEVPPDTPLKNLLALCPAQ